MGQFEFQQGDIIWFNFPVEKPNPQYKIKGPHPALLLHDHTLPNQTVVLAPLSSLYDNQGNVKELKSYHLPLYKKDYPKLKNDSYVKLDQIMTFSRNKIGDYICSLNEIDKASLHLKLIESLQMQDTIREIVFRQIEQTVQELIEKYVEDMIKKEST
ncbi:type II toxin-antitoxin system PemK/MazF family toxin [Anoxybacillus sp. J5B_2022]|uniref:type II toxin-antitoxin system PemK/MazF family toxin n=1 Tax=Anoxybacillus sp. J5B_2022 TaxID=3003246 RepID=UPI00228584D9|nr:type II toxin-antitoxin system PemK/MazF family toxin [Anoxybacillus sp. J5B_2022]MCZ0757082.1 type II toxin-antitoxin system PemK/MazF family toxin [Anoxybacillus sp. J5B_2022]